MDLKIRQENRDDINEIYKIHTLAFGQENEGKLVDLLRDSDTFVPELSLVATIDNKIVGHILFTKIKIADDNQNEFDSLALAPIAIKPDIQKKGIGGQLIRAGLNKARELNFESVIVLGHEHYYPKFGFVPTTKWNIKSPFDVATNLFMGLELMEGGLKNVSGIVKYPKEFDSV
ncbi:MAG: N-acetyltransferase [Saprospiraceae bacterium]|nr:N-acetyltransferase [Saprospiraceae bacterium]